MGARGGWGGGECARGEPCANERLARSARAYVCVCVCVLFLRAAVDREMASFTSASGDGGTNVFESGK